MIFGKVYTCGCKWKCGYCFVPEIVKARNGMSGREAVEKIKASRVMQAICVTGGEPTEQKDLPIFLRNLKLLGLKIMIETNGENPEMLKKIINRKLVDFVRLDVKGPFEKYEEITRSSGDGVIESLKALTGWNGYWEVVTVWHPQLDREDLAKMSKSIPGKWVIVPFEKGNCMDPKLNIDGEWDEEFLAGLKDNVWVRTKTYERRLS